MRRLWMVVANRQHVAKVPGQVAAFDRVLSAWNTKLPLSKANLVARRAGWYRYATVASMPGRSP